MIALEKFLLVPGALRGLAAARAKAFTQAERSLRHRPEDLSGVGSSPWADLDLQDIYGKVKACRLRQHVNPLRAEFQKPKEAPDWNVVYEDPTLPLVLDIGCAGGRFVLALAQGLKDHNFLGLDIRRPLIERANNWAKTLHQEGHMFFEVANATVSLESILCSYPGEITLATIQFPDPHFKKRHKKRRIVQPILISALSKLISPQGTVFLQSDVEDVAAAMRDEFEEFSSDHFCLADEHRDPSKVFHSRKLPSDAQRQHEGRPAVVVQETTLMQRIQVVTESPKRPSLNRQWALAGFLKDNPIGVPTEREVQTLKQGSPVYRVLLRRT